MPTSCIKVGRGLSSWTEDPSVCKCYFSSNVEWFSIDLCQMVHFGCAFYTMILKKSFHLPQINLTFKSLNYYGEAYSHSLKTVVWNLIFPILMLEYFTVSARGKHVEKNRAMRHFSCKNFMFKSASPTFQTVLFLYHN